MVENVFFQHPACPQSMWIGFRSHNTYANCCVYSTTGGEHTVNFDGGDSQAMDCQLYTPMKKPTTMFELFRKRMCSFKKPSSIW